MTGPVLALRVEGYTIEEIAHLLALDATEARQQLAADLDASPYALLGETVAVHLHRCDVLAAALDLAESRPCTPAHTALIDQHRAAVDHLRDAATDRATERAADRLSEAAITRADRGQP